MNTANSKVEFRNTNSGGFTLLEVMVAVSILALVIVSLLGLRNRSVQDVILAERITTATMLAERVMTGMLSRPLASLEEEGEFDEEDFKDFTWKKVVAPTPVPGIMEARVAVLWKEGERGEMVELVSYE
jgi:general secretion pathway protein I